MSLLFLMVLKRELREGVGGLESLAWVRCGWAESPNHQWRGTSEASGAWPRRWSGRCVDGGLWCAAAPWSSGRDRRCGWADGLQGLSRDGSLLERRKDARGRKAWHCPPGAVCGSLGCGFDAEQTDTVCASSRNGCPLPARNTSGGILPGRGVEE